MLVGQFEKCVNVIPPVLELIEETGSEWERFHHAYVIYPSLQWTYGLSRAMVGDFAEGETACEKALVSAVATKDVRTLGGAEMAFALYELEQGKGEAAAEHALNAIQHHEESLMLLAGPVDWTLLGAAHYLLRKLETAREHLEKALTLAASIGLKNYLAFFYYFQSLVHFDLGDREWALKRMEEASEHAEELGQGHYEGLCRIGLGRMLAKTNSSRRETAAASIRRGIALLEDLKLKPWYAQGHLALGELYAAAGEQVEALQNLRKAEEMFSAMGMDYYLDKTRQVLAKL
jgi:tetratricopeptide (TPR) repeat protein